MSDQHEASSSKPESPPGQTPESADSAALPNSADGATTEPAAQAEPAAEANATGAPSGDTSSPTASAAEPENESEPESEPATENEPNKPEPDRFNEFGLPEPLTRAIDDLGFTHCTPIQQGALPYSLADYDVTGQAQTGTGKTAAFLITVFSRLWEDETEAPEEPGVPRALVLAPTRELALQIEQDALDLNKHLDFGVLCVVGGINFDQQQARLRNEMIDLLIATPGRLIDFINRGDVNLRFVEVMVIDEADRMLDMGFIPDVRRIIGRTPPKQRRQTLFFSATYNFDVLNLARQWTMDPVHIAIEPEQVATDTVDQRVYLTSDKEKFTVLYNVLQTEAVSSALIFANRRDVTNEVCERLQAMGVKCEQLSGDVHQRKRLKTLEQFKSGELPFLVATDVAGRGIHVEGLSHVINYNLPEDPEDYVHRIGRTGRAGATGTSISLVSEADAFDLPAIETLIGRKIPSETPSEELTQAINEPYRPRRPRGRPQGRSGGGARGGGRSGGSGRGGPGRR